MSNNDPSSLIKSYQTKQVIYNAGDPGETMYVVHQGTVSLTRVGYAGKKLISQLKKGDFFGELEVIDGQARLETATAEEDCLLLEIDPENFNAIISKNMEIVLRIIRKYAQRLRLAEAKLERLAAENREAKKQVSPQKAALTEKPFNGNARIVTSDGKISFPINKRISTLGRFDPVTGVTPDIDLSEIDQQRTVSRRHARIIYRDKRFYLVEELAVHNGTFLGAEKLKPLRPKIIKNNQTIIFGKIPFVFQFQLID